MHPRNIFKGNKPNFSALAMEFPDFKPYVKKNLSGKSFVDFKDPAALRALSVVLLKKYFDIDIDIPLDRLIPTVPLRLNYIHWIEDLLLSGVQNDGVGKLSDGNEHITGVDVGCGASCIYGLLGNMMNKWKFICTEIDSESYRFAEQNVSRNKLDEHIQIIDTDKEGPFFQKVLNHSNTSSKPFDFSMCNPPFFSETNEKTTGKKKPPPNSVSTATENERSTKGGEVEYIKRMIQESCNIKTSFRWFTTMLGKKSSVKPLVKYLKEVEVPTLTTTEFQQGRTMRWGLAWSFIETTAKLPEKPAKPKKPKSFHLAVTEEFYKEYSVQPSIDHDTSSKEMTTILWDITKVIEKELKELEVDFETPEHIQIMNSDAYEIIGKALKITWLHSRRKRRRELQDKKMQCDGKSEIMMKNNVCPDETDSELYGKRKFDSGENSVEILDNHHKRIKLENDGDNTTSNSSSIKLEDDGDKDIDISCLFSFSCTISSAKQCHVAGGKTPVISLMCIDGDRDKFHQMFLFFKNKLHCKQVKSL